MIFQCVCVCSFTGKWQLWPLHGVVFVFVNLKNVRRLLAVFLITDNLFECTLKQLWSLHRLPTEGVKYWFGNANQPEARELLDFIVHQLQPVFTGSCKVCRGRYECWWIANTFMCSLPSFCVQCVCAHLVEERSEIKSEHCTTIQRHCAALNN